MALVPEIHKVTICSLYTLGHDYNLNALTKLSTMPVWEASTFALAPWGFPGYPFTPFQDPSPQISAVDDRGEILIRRYPIVSDFDGVDHRRGISVLAVAETALRRGGVLGSTSIVRVLTRIR